MRESVMESLKKSPALPAGGPKGDAPQPPPKGDAPQPSPEGGWLQAFLQHPWGRRAAIALVVVLAFLVGYIIGRWGRSDLEAQIQDLQKAVQALKGQNLDLSRQNEQLAIDKEKAEKELNRIKNYNLFVRYRMETRTHIQNALAHLGMENWEQAQRSLAEAKIKLGNENQNQNAQAMLYRTVIRRIDEAAALMRDKCQPQGKTPGSPLEWVERCKGSPECLSTKSCIVRISAMLDEILNVLPPPREYAPAQDNR